LARRVLGAMVRERQWWRDRPLSSRMRREDAVCAQAGIDRLQAFR
jgi:hypothetical protein